MMGLCRWLFLALTLCFACSPKKEGEKAEKAPAVTSPVGLAEEGKSIFSTCKTCHGEQGEGNPKLHAPALANSDGWYLYRQLMNFRKGLRGYMAADTLGMQMAAMANTLKDSVAVSNVVAYIETLPGVSTPTTITGDIKKGERTYQSICGSCHGPEGKGNEAMHAPRLNGLDDWYVKTQIHKFKDLLRGMHPHDTYGAQMVPMVILLKDDQAVNDVIAYIHSVQPAEQ